MQLKEITVNTFLEYVKTSPLKSYMQSEEYALFMKQYKYYASFVGLFNDKDKLVASSLILIKKMSFNTRYGYAPKGFLINYYDTNLMKVFIQKLKEFFAKKNVAFIKINPEIVVAEIDKETLEVNKNANMKLKSSLQGLGFMKLKDNLYFEALVPRFNAYIDLKNANFKNYSKPNRNKVRNGRRKGLYLDVGSIDDMEVFYNMLHTRNKIDYFKHFYECFNDKIELLLVKVNYEQFIKNSQELYDKELANNALLNEILHGSQKKNDLNSKMASDKRLVTIKNEIIDATQGLKSANNRIVAGALVVKYDNRVHIIASGFDRNFASLNANYFMYDEIIEKYKNDFDYLDLNGISGDFKKSNPYRGLNNFKLGFNPKIYEYIGEFDLVFNKVNYTYLLSTGRLSHEFDKKK